MKIYWPLCVALALLTSNVSAREKEEVFKKYDSYMRCLTEPPVTMDGLSENEIWAALGQIEARCEDQKQDYLALVPAKSHNQIEQRFRKQKRSLYLELTE